jgi:hypothetical protein
MPRQPVAVKLVAGEILQAGEATALVADPIDLVPIEPLPEVRPAG